MFAVGVVALSGTPVGAVTNTQVKSKALALNDMPAGWSVDNSSSGGVSNVGGCLAGLEALKKPPRGIARAEVEYTDGQYPSLQETVEAGKGAVTRYNKFLKILDSCKTLSFTSSGLKVTGNVGAMSFPTVGDSSHAFAMNLEADGQTFGVDLVLFRVGEYDGDMLYLDVSPDPSTVETFATESVNKIEGKPVSAPSTSNSSGTL